MDSIGEAPAGSAQSEPVVSVRGLVKRYGSHEAVAGIDLEVRRGEIFAFLGPNGAGKTTTVEILEGFRQPTKGQVCVLGHDPATAGGAWRDRVGVVLQESEPEPGLSVRECLGMYAGFYRAPRDIDETIALAGLTEKAGALGTRLSGGQRRRLDFALALIGDPELIFLDEPTTGFDPSARRAAWEVIAGAPATRQDRLPHHPSHGRGGVPGRPDHGALGRAHRGRGHAGHAGRAGPHDHRHQLHAPGPRASA